MRYLLASLAVLASPALAEVDVRQAVIDLALASNCVITDATAEASFPPLGLTKEDVGPVVEDMIQKGEAELVDNELHLSIGLCPIDGPVAPVVPAVPSVSPLMARVIEVFHANGCTMDEDKGMPALLAAGITEAELETLDDETEALVEAGLMIQDEATFTITIAEPLCSGAIASAEPAEPLIRMLTEHGCALSQDEAAGLIAGYGITMDSAHEMAESLIERGLAREEGEKLLLANCGG